MDEEKYTNLTMRSIGFGEFNNKEFEEEIRLDVMDNPTQSFIREYKDGRMVLEYYKEYSERLYVIVRTGLHSRIKEEVTTVYNNRCEPYFKAKYDLEVKDLEVGEVGPYFACYAVCDDAATGMPIIFKVQNMIEYLDCLQDNTLDYSGINVVGVATEGTIILPVEKDRHDQSSKAENQYLRGLLERARSGDKEALDILDKEERKIDVELKERLRKEDFLTVMEGYFIPTTDMDAVYAVLGTIQELETRENKKTMEEIYWFNIDVNGMLLEIVINKKDLRGVPCKGMRFMGTCKVQGTVCFDLE
ncbi:MAG: DUF3881 family protein [Epulopiscium sp.]|nr:DUF3881 family protein [Candidatus Epulonipiscium sp.]